MTDKKSKILFYIFTLLFCSTVIFSYLKYVTFKDFAIFEGEVAEEEVLPEETGELLPPAVTEE